MFDIPEILLTRLFCMRPCSCRFWNVSVDGMCMVSAYTETQSVLIWISALQDKEAICISIYMCCTSEVDSHAARPRRVSMLTLSIRCTLLNDLVTSGLVSRYSKGLRSQIVSASERSTLYPAFNTVNNKATCPAES